MPIPQCNAPAGYNTLLVPTDFSAHSQAAVTCAASIAKRTGGKLVIAHVMPPEKWHLVPPQDMHPALAYNRRFTEKKMAGLLRSERLRGIRTDTVIKEGDFRRVLCRIADQHHADLLVAGTHGRKGLSKLLFGSKAEGVCNKAHCPVLLLGPKLHLREDCGFGKVLFATDLSPLSLKAFPAVLAFVVQHGSWLKVVRLVQGDTAAEAGCDDVALAQLKSELIVTNASISVSLVHEPEFAVEHGSAKETILRVAEEWNADVIGMGAHRPGTLGVYLPGDLAYEVASDAHCPVLTVIS
jgi:nucleotide-binding universal stress UspA family protein